MEMTRQDKIKRLQSLQSALESCTQPVRGHTDPLSINDCWNWMRELLEELRDEDEKLLLRAEQFEREQKWLADHTGFKPSHAESELGGMRVIVNLIKRHLGVAKEEPVIPADVDKALERLAPDVYRPLKDSREDYYDPQPGD